MGRQRSGDNDFARWRREWHRRLVRKHGRRFADEVMDALNDDVEAFGVGDPDARKLRETTLPALVANTRRGRDGATG